MIQKVVTFKEPKNKGLDPIRGNSELSKGDNSPTGISRKATLGADKDTLNESMARSVVDEEEQNSDDWKSSYDPDSPVPKEEGESSDDNDVKEGQAAMKTDDMQTNEDGLIKIPSLEDDVKEKNSIDYYLRQCLIYAQENLMQIEKPIMPYQFKYEDIQNNIFNGTSFTLDASISNLRKMYKPTEKQFYNDIIFVKG